MEGFALYAVIGLLLLVPLEMLLLILVAALTRRRGFAPLLALPSPKRQERYGWEDMLKLSPERKPSGSRKAIIAVIVILLLVVIVAVPSLFIVAPSLHLNLSGQPANDTAAVLPPFELNETPARGIFSTLTLPRLNIAAPGINMSKVFSPLKSNIKAVALVLAAVFASLVVLFFVLRRRRLAVINKARETPEKLIRKAAAEKSGKAPENSFFSRLRKYVAPVSILFLLIVMAFLVYFLRGRIRNEFSGKLLSFAVSAKEFALNYRLYILAGIVILAISIVLLRLIAGRRQKPA